MKKISFIIPCYRSENTIREVVDEIRNIIVKENLYTYEIILINDNSPDKTFSIISDICKEDEKVIGIDLARNFGQHAAIMTGLHYINGDIVAFLDDDGQTPACEVFKLINRLNEGYDVVFAKYKEKKQKLYRRIGSKINDIMAQWLISKPKDLEIMSYFVCKRFIANEMLNYNNPFPYIAGLVLRATNNITNVEIKQRERIEGQSGYNLKKLLSIWLNGFTAFSVKPLRVATILGLICAFLGGSTGVYIVINKIINKNVIAGYSSLMATLLFIGGMIMLLLGIIGEYIGRIYISINNSPQYVVRTVIQSNQEKVQNEIM